MLHSMYRVLTACTAAISLARVLLSAVTSYITWKFVLRQPATMHQSHLLRALDQLDGTAWAEMLLKLLDDDKSGGNFALSCKRVRKLSLAIEKHLLLESSTCMHMGPATPLDYLRQHFPICSVVEYVFCSHKDLLYPWMRIVRLLARLPKLSLLKLDLKVFDEEALPALLLGLEVLRLQLPQLRELVLHLDGSSIVSARTGLDTGAGPLWEILGQTTQLTQLWVEMSRCTKRGFLAQGVSALLPLSSRLSDLSLDEEPATDPQYPSFDSECWGFLSHLTCLTNLEVSLGSSRTGLAAIRSCTALRRLAVKFTGHPVTAGAGSRLSEEECAALGQLTGLTRLLLTSPWGSSRRAADGVKAGILQSLLQPLQQLQELHLGPRHELEFSHLPVLAALPSLTYLDCEWTPSSTQQETDWQGASCPQVLRHETFYCSIPIQSLPGLTALIANERMKPSQLVAVAQHCRQLAHLDLANVICRPRASKDRVAALRSLTALQHLTHLKARVQGKTEVAAVSALSQLRRLVLTLGRKVHPAVLSSLCKLTQLRSLSLDIYCDGLYYGQPTERDATALLHALGGAVQCVEICTRQQSCFMAAIAAAQAAGVPLPNKLRLCKEPLT